MSDDTDLLPCPFCGKPPAIEMTGFHLGARTIRCETDDCMGPHTTAQNMDDATIQWNRRQAASQGNVDSAQGWGIWRAGAPPKPWSQEWFIARTTYGDRVVLRALPDEWTYDFRTADDTYIKADKIKKWMQFPDSQFIAPTSGGDVAAGSGEPDGYRAAWLEMIEHCNALKADRFRLEQTIRDSIESLERNSTSAPVVECLKAALALPSAERKTP